MAAEDKCPRCGQQSSPGCPFCEMVATFDRVLPSPPAPYPPDTWRIIDGEITRTTTYSTSSYTTTLCWCQGCEEPWMMYDDGSGTHGDCLGPSVPLGSLLPMQSGSSEVSDDD